MDDNGFCQEHMPLHVVEGIGDPIGMLRDPPPPRRAALRLAAEAGCGDSSYQGYDERIAEAAEAWLRQRALSPDARPWVLFVSLVCPHFPLIARPEWYNLYTEEQVPWPEQYAKSERPTHPYVEAMRACQIYDEGFDDPSKVRKAIAAYFGLVASSTTTLDGCSRSSTSTVSPTPRASSTPPITAITSARAGCGASPTCTRNRRAYR